MQRAMERSPLPRQGEGLGVRALPVVAAFLTWLAVLCAILIVAWPHWTLSAGLLDVRTLALVDAIAVALTLGLATVRAPAVVGYVAAHLAGATLLLGVMQGSGLLAVTFPHAAFPWGIPRVTLAPGMAPFSVSGDAVTPATNVVLSLGLTWELAYAAAWLVVRERRPWLALGLVVATPLLTAHPRGREPLFFALCLVGLAIVAVTAARERRRPALVHGRHSIPLAPRLAPLSVGLRLALALLGPLGAGLIAVAWALPVPPDAAVRALRTARMPPPPLATWGTAARGIVARVGGGGHAGDATGLSLFGADLAVGGAFHPDNTPVLLGRVADPSRSPYWRGALYDRYAGGTWRSVPARRVHVGANRPLGGLDGVAVVAPITQEIDLLRPSNVLFTAGAPLRVGVSATVSLGGVSGAPAGLLSLEPAAGAMSGVYTAVSAAAPLAPLARAPALSPGLRALDLALPPLPPRVAALARRLMSYSDDPYTRAWDIQSYLHARTYAYDTAPPAAPAGQDPVDYFLFQSRRGFCTHFATAMVVLARAAGIPARLVTGYAAGHLVGGHFVVTTADAHAWPELWIGGRGWLTFEPTPSFPTPFQTGPGPVMAPPTLMPSPETSTAPASAPAGASGTAARPARGTATVAGRSAVAVSTTPSGTSGGGGAGGSRGGGSGFRLTWPPRPPRVTLPRIWPSTLPWRIPLAAPLAALALLILLGCGLALARRRRPDVATLYGRMCRLAGRLGAGPTGGQTPLEWAAALARRSPADGSIALTIAGLYARQRYGGETAAPEDLMVALTAWRALRRRWRRRLLTRRRLA